MAFILVVVRNKDGAFTFGTLRPYLVELAQLCYGLGLDDRRGTLESMMHRGDLLLRDGFKSENILQLYTDWVPNPRFRQSIAKQEHDRGLMLKMVKAKGSSSNTAVMLALQNAGLGGGGSVPAALPAPAPQAAPYFSTVPQLPAAPLPAVHLGSLTLPLPSAGQAVQLPHQAPSQGSGGGGGATRTKKGKGKGATPGQPTPQAAQARVDYNKQLKALQQAALPHPAGYLCQKCANQGRTAHHQAHECAYEECTNCRRGGHRAKHCTFPKYP